MTRTSTHSAPTASSSSAWRWIIATKSLAPLWRRFSSDRSAWSVCWWTEQVCSRNMWCRWSGIRRELSSCCYSIFKESFFVCSIIQELDISATDLSSECLIDMLTRIPNLKFLSAGQINGFNDTVLKAWMESGTCRSLTALDLDSSDNLSDEALNKFVTRYGSQLQSCVLSGMSHITDQLWMAILPLLSSAKILVMGTHERLSVNIHVDQLMDAIATNCPKLERLELRWVTKSCLESFT